jgi:hypothetical protein
VRGSGPQTRPPAPPAGHVGAGPPRGEGRIGDYGDAGEGTGLGRGRGGIVEMKRGGGARRTEERDGREE